VPESCKSVPLEMVFPGWIRKERINGMEYYLLKPGKILPQSKKKLDIQIEGN
jgi:hypothetical protein